MQRGQWYTRFLVLLHLDRINCSQPEDRCRNLLIQTEVAKILAGHRRWYKHDVIVAQSTTEYFGQSFSQLRFIEGCGCNFSVAELDDRCPVVWDAGGQRDTFGDAFDRRQQPLPDFLFVGTNRKLQVNFIRNDVVASPAM